MALHFGILNNHRFTVMFPLSSRKVSFTEIESLNRKATLVCTLKGVSALCRGRCPLPMILLIPFSSFCLLLSQLSLIPLVPLPPLLKILPYPTLKKQQNLKTLPYSLHYNILLFSLYSNWIKMVINSWGLTMWQALMLTTMEMIPFNPLKIPRNEGFINPVLQR